MQLYYIGISISTLTINVLNLSSYIVRQYCNYNNTYLASNFRCQHYFAWPTIFSHYIGYRLKTINFENVMLLY